MKIKNASLAITVLLSVALLSAGFATTDSSTTAKPDEKPVTAIKEVHRGQHVLLAGTVKRITDSDEFRLEDASGKIKIYIGWKNRMPVTVGETVKVWGVADDDTFPGFRPEIYAYALELASGRKIDLSRGYD